MKFSYILLKNNHVLLFFMLQLGNIEFLVARKKLAYHKQKRFLQTVLFLKYVTPAITC